MADIPVTVSYLGEGMNGPSYQAAITQVTAMAGSRPETRAAFVQAWNEQTGDERTEDDFAFSDIQ